ncbi:hypothetical protein SAMN05446037_100652 [Anaerovirgula multivorans]|uniref:Uncharacterized protein n=1 Tax=Anaerovirgula multivorans TaxID=312168 RepID=A0A239CPP3_9FIRM|nr:hypothetical protein [Anaerovirgula multivorans]SNS21353.1 hypothetical protein SAMN05446037_100652 [Anaerovirgula multivorans]
MLPKVIKASLEVDVESEGKKPKKKVSFTDPVDEWGFHHFRRYFEYLYQFKLKSLYMPVGGDLKQLSNLLKVKDKDIVKQYMEYFIELDFFEVKHLRVFCSSYSQAILDGYHQTGDLPEKKKNEFGDIFGGD